MDFLRRLFRGNNNEDCEVSDVTAFHEHEQEKREQERRIAQQQQQAMENQRKLDSIKSRTRVLQRKYPQ